MYRARSFLLGLLAVCGWPASAVPLVLPANPAAEEIAFAAALTNALQTTNVAALVALCYCERDEPWAAEWYFRHLLQHPCDEVRLVRSDSPHAAAFLPKLEGARSTLALRWVVLLRQPPLPFEATSTNMVVLPASFLNGEIVLTRRMAMFTSLHKQLLLAAAAIANLLAIAYALKFARLSRAVPEGRRYAPLGLSVLLICFGIFCVTLVFRMPVFLDHPLRWLGLPLAGLVIVFAASLADEHRKPAAGASAGRETSSPLDALAQAWRAWKNQEGPFASAKVTAAVMVVVMTVACWLVAYLWRGTSIQWHPRHVQGRVVQSPPRSGIHYVYQVGDRLYSGSGVGSSARVYPPGSPVDVKYSTAHTAWSTIDDDPFLFLEQLACGLAFVFGMLLLASVKRRPKSRTSGL